MRLAVDFHVHIYPFFSPAAVLANIGARVRCANCEGGALFLTERKDCDWYAQQPKSGLSESIVVEANGVPCLIFPGFQVVTAGGLEVHALATSHRPKDGMSLSETIASVLKSGGTPMLGWGAGKWLGNRGRLISSLLRDGIGEQVRLGDSRQRPWGWPAPDQFKGNFGRQILCGSDPLPLSGEEYASLSFGHIFDVPVDGIDHISAKTLLNCTSTEQLGGRLDPIRFGMLQTRLRI